MTLLPRAVRRLALAPSRSLSLASPVAGARRPGPPPQPHAICRPATTPWLYRGSDVPQDKEWLFGEMPNGLRYAVRQNGVPPGQVSIRVRIDAGSLHERDSERAMPTCSSTCCSARASISADGAGDPDLAAARRDVRQRHQRRDHADADGLQARPARMRRRPSSTKASSCCRAWCARRRCQRSATSAPKCRSCWPKSASAAAPAQRVAEATPRDDLRRPAARRPLADRHRGDARTARPRKRVRAFHDRWYRPENTVIVGRRRHRPGAARRRWSRSGSATGRARARARPAPGFGDPGRARRRRSGQPGGRDRRCWSSPTCRAALTYAVLRPWRPVNDTIVYNQGLMIDSLAQAIINRRLEAARARGRQLSLSRRSTRRTSAARSTRRSSAVAPLDRRLAGRADGRPRGDRRCAGHAADAGRDRPRNRRNRRGLRKSRSSSARCWPGRKLADDIVNAVDIRETVAAPETVLLVFRGMKRRSSPRRTCSSTPARCSPAR